MNDRPYDATADILQLYELSLAVGRSLDVHESCEQFLTLLLARRRISYAAVWLFEGNSARLVYAHPRARALEMQLPRKHPSFAAIAGREVVSRAASEPDYIDLIAE